MKKRKRSSLRRVARVFRGVRMKDCEGTRNHLCERSIRVTHRRILRSDDCMPSETRNVCRHLRIPAITFLCGRKTREILQGTWATRPIWDRGNITIVSLAPPTIFARASSGRSPGEIRRFSLIDVHFFFPSANTKLSGAVAEYATPAPTRHSAVRRSSS